MKAGSPRLALPSPSKPSSKSSSRSVSSKRSSATSNYTSLLAIPEDDTTFSSVAMQVIQPLSTTTSLPPLPANKVQPARETFHTITTEPSPRSLLRKMDTIGRSSARRLSMDQRSALLARKVLHKTNRSSNRSNKATLVA